MPQKNVNVIRYSFEKQIIFFFLVSVLMLVIVFINIQKNNKRFNDSSRQLENTSEVVLLTEQIHAISAEMQASVRGFIITEDEIYLPRFNNASASIGSHIGRVYELTSDQPTQHNNIDTLNLLANIYITSRKDIIAAIKQRKADKKVLQEKTDGGRVTTDKLRSHINSIQLQQKQLMADYKQQNDESIQRTSKLILLLCIGAVLLLIAAFIIIYKNTLLRNKIESELKESNNKFFRVFYLSPLAMVIRDLDSGKILDVNDEYERLVGYKKKTLIGKTSFEAGMVLNKEIGELLRKTVSEKKLVRNTETVLYNARNEAIHVDVSLQKIRIGERNCLLSALLDVTKRKEAEAKIREMNLHLEKMVEAKTKEALEKEREYRFLLENMQEGIQIIGSDFRYLFVNDAVARQRKSSKEELIGRTMFDTYPAFQSTALFGTLEKCMKEQTMQVLENEFVYTDHSSAWFELRMQPVPEGVFILSMDITHRKQAEKMLKQLNEKLEKRAIELQASNTELERFAYVASHDLQEPLRMVSSFLHLLEKKMAGKLDETTKKYIDFAVDGAERMKRLIQDLLQYSRVGTKEEKKTDLDCNLLLKRVLNILHSNINEANAIVHVGPLPVIKAVELQMQQVFQNLIGNAIKYRGEAIPEIEIGFMENDAAFEFYVKDNGIGIDPRFFDKIFIIFQRLHNKSEYQGTGIGLAICKKIIEKHGGKIWVTSEPGKGCEFYFSIPKKIHDA